MHLEVSFTFTHEAIDEKLIRIPMILRYSVKFQTVGAYSDGAYRQERVVKKDDSRQA